MIPLTSILLNTDGYYLNLMGYYDELTRFEWCIARFSHEISIVAALEISGKIDEEESYRRIRKLYKALKKNRKTLKDDDADR